MLLVMTYGVDECRICGKAMRPSDSKAMDRYRDSLGRTTMPEAEWRKAGFKAMPTRKQVRVPLDGVCYNCKLPLKLKSTPLLPMLLPLVGALIALILAMFYLGSAFT